MLMTCFLSHSFLPWDQTIYCAQAGWKHEGYKHWAKPTNDCKLWNGNANWEPHISSVASHNYNTSAAYGTSINVTTNIHIIGTVCFQLQNRKDRKK